MTRKQPAAADDYSLAYSIVTDMKSGRAQIVDVSNIKAFRKYVCDLGVKQGKKFYTRKNTNGLLVGRIS